MIHLEPVQPLFLARALQLHLGPLSQPEEVVQVAFANSQPFAGVCEPLQTVLPDGLEQAVPGLGRRQGLDDDHGLVHQPAEQVEHILRRKPVTSADILGRLKLEPPGESGHAAEEHPLGLGQQVVPPVERGTECLVVWQAGPRPSGEQPEPVFEPGGDLLDRQHLGPRRGQLDRQREAIEAPAQLDDCADVGAGDRKPRLRERRALDEEPYGGRLVGQLWRDGVRRVRQREGLHLEDDLTRDTQRLPARRQDPERGGVAQQERTDLGRCREHMLAVVEHQQERSGSQIVDQDLGGGPRRFPKAQHRGDGLRDDRRVGNRRQFHEPDPIRERVEAIRGGLDRQSRLPRAARSAEGDQVGPGQEALDLSHLRFPADEARRLHRKVVRRHIERPQRRKALGQVEVDDLMQPFRPLQVSQAVRAEVAQGGAVGQVAGHKSAGSL